MSMSTDGAPIKPVYFIAEDKQTNTHLRINDFDKAFPVTPRDGRKPCKTLLVTVARKFSWKYKQNLLFRSEKHRAAVFDVTFSI